MEGEKEVLLLYPIHFKSKIKKDILIDGDIKLRRITEKEIQDIFNLKVQARTKDGLITQCLSKFSNLDTPFITRHTAYKYFIESSQFILEAKSAKKIEYFQQALILYKDGRTGISFGIHPKSRNLRFFYPVMPCYGKEVYSLKEVDIPKIKELYGYIKNIKNKIFDLIIEKFLFALSGEGIRNEHRFLELVSILEILYLSGESGEFTFKISLRTAKVLSKYLSFDSEEVFDKMKKIYKVRCGISHSGYHKDTKEYLNDLINYTRQSIKLFLQENSLFTKGELDKLCIKD